MAIIRSRQALVGCRTQLVNHVRGAVKSFGPRLPKCPARSFHKRAPEHIPEALWPALGAHPRADRLAHRAHPSIRPTAGDDLQRALPGNRAPAPGRGDRAAHGAHLRAHRGGSLPLREEPLGGGIPGAGARHRPVGGQRPPETHLQGGRRDAEEAPGRKRPLRPGSLRLGLGPQAPRRKDSLSGEARTPRNGRRWPWRGSSRVLLHRLWVTGEVYDPLHNTHRRQEKEAA